VAKVSRSGNAVWNAAVSAVIPVYNSGELAAEAIQSVYAQTVRPSEVIVVDDGSTDHTPPILRRFEGRPGFILIRKPNGGEASARNAGLERATGDYIAFLDHDDLWHAEKLERQLEHFASDPGLALSFTGYSLAYRGEPEAHGRNRAPKVIRHKTWDPDPDQVLDQLLSGRCPIGTLSTVMMRRAALARVTPFDEGLLLLSDYLMYLRFAAARMKMDYLPDVLVEYRWHGFNLSGDIRRDHLCQMLDRLCEHYASELPEQVRMRARWWRARWHFLTAIDAIQTGDTPRARRHIIAAARVRPLSIRPGWIRMLGIGSAPAARDPRP
jgi:glycosyltransferase involved in cell wall biosynthesis